MLLKYDNAKFSTGLCFLLAFALVFSIANIGATSYAQSESKEECEYPTKPITWINSLSPGGGTDRWMRVMAGAVGPILGQPINIDYKTGGGGTIAANYVINSKPDGYTLLGSTTSVVVSPLTIDVPFDVLNDLIFVTRIVALDQIIVVRPDAPWKSFSEMVQYAKENPGALEFGIYGVGSLGHLMALDLFNTLGIKVTMVPYKGASPIISAIAGEHIDFTQLTQAAISGPVSEGILRPIITYADERLKIFPDTPTLKEEMGIDLGYDKPAPGGIAVPKATPECVIEKLENAYRQAMEDKVTIDLLKRVGASPAYLSREDYTKQVTKIYSRFKKIIEEMDIKK
jgi:tripartite-type tricarboxylate transporter receptor subunit TctC